MKKFIYHILIFLSVAIPSYAEEDYRVDGYVFEKTYNTPVVNATVKVLSASDSTLITTTKADRYTINGEITDNIAESQKSYTGGFKVFVARPGKYIFEISHEKYEPIYVNVIIKNKDYYQDIGKKYLNPVAKELDDVVVKASKVMFYNKGDTLVYNADAFILAEGSMLDALIKQLPNVELKDNGQIMVNGRFVDALLLNGKDFFGDNRQLMLDNLGAYTVKNIEVYDKMSRSSEIAGVDLGDSSYVMDVKLKKEYMVGTNINVEAGYGTHSRYLGRLFAMAFTPHNQYAAYFNTNNLNDSRKPGQDGSWTPETMPTGVRKTVSGGADYSLRPQNDKWELDGHANVESANETDGTNILRTNFLPNANTYDYMFGRSRNRSLSLSTNHKVYFKGVKGYGIATEPYLNYRRWNNYQEDISATFDENYNNITADFISSIYDGNSTNALRHILNRNLSQNKRKGHSLSTGGNLWHGIKMPWGPNLLVIEMKGEYSNIHDDRFNSFAINFGVNPDPARASDRYFKNYPDYKSKAEILAKYVYPITSKMSFGIDYSFTHGFRKETSILYRLEDSGSIANYTFGKLPSAFNFSTGIDYANSYLSRLTENNNRINLQYYLFPSIMDLKILVPVIFASRELHYERGKLDEHLKKNSILLDKVQLQLDLEWEKRKHELFFYTQIESKAPDLLTMIDLRDEVDPMNIYIGNPNLKEALNHDSYLRYLYRIKGSKQVLTASLSYSVLYNAIAQGIRYNMTTGVRELKHYNINGNWTINGGASYRQDFGKFILYNVIRAGKTTSVDLIGDSDMELTYNKVYDLNFSDKLSFEYKFGIGKATLNFDGRFNRFTGNSEDFISQNTWTIKTALTALVNLPYNFEISTDFNVFNRRGYMDRNLNTDNFVWNARLTYKALKGRLLFMLDGYDILHDLKNVSYTMNAQARTETYRTVLPRYFMFHIQWRFNHTPLKK